MSKIKMRCANCGKWFQSANAKEVTCPDCVQKARKDKLASKTAPPAGQKLPGQGTRDTNPVRPTTTPSKSRPTTTGTSHWFDSVNDVKVSEPEPPVRSKPPSSPSPAPTAAHGGGSPRNSSPAPYRERDERGPAPHRHPGGYQERTPGNSGGYRGPGAYRNAPLSGSIVGGINSQSPRPRQPMAGDGASRGQGRGGVRPGGERHFESKLSSRPNNKPVAPRKPKPVVAPKPKRPKIPPPEPFKATPEQITQVEERYKELAVPAEFDGIRSQISHELGIPKKAVKDIVKALREREHIPSWWETQTYKGDNEEKERIKAAYEPFLPVPPVGVHRNIADQLDLKPGIVYQAIKLIRQEMNLPQYNDPTYHEAEFEEIKRKAHEAREAKELAAQQAALTESEEMSPAETTEAQVSSEVPLSE